VIVPYKRLCISMYTDDLRRMDALVAEIRAKGFLCAGRSGLIRYALTLVDVERIPREVMVPRGHGGARP
jgi:hypothetical protein